MSKAKGIYLALRAYTCGWDGQVPPGRDSYVKMAGHKLKGEHGYDPRAAEQVMDFRCPADRNPRKNAHGYFSSYRVLPWPSPGSGLTMSAYDTLAVYEKGKRHPLEGQLEAVYVFLDAHATLGCDRLLPCLNLTIWRWRPGIWDRVKNDPRLVPPDYEDDWWCGGVALDTGMSESFHRDVSSGDDGGVVAAATDPVVVQLEGMVSFSEPGEQEFVLKYTRQVYLWVDANRNEQVDPPEVIERVATVKYEECSFRCGGLVTGAPYRIRLLFTRNRGDLPTSVWRVTPQGRREQFSGWEFLHELN